MWQVKPSCCRIGFGGLVIGALAAVFSSAGCERKERVLDVETPGVDVEVERNKDTGRIDVEVDRKK